MKAFFKALFLIVAFGASAQAQSPAMILPRNLLIVSDMEASKKFYSYALGMKITRGAAIADKITFKHLGLADTHTAHIVVMEPSKSLYGVERDRALIALLQVGNPPLPKSKRASNLIVGEVVMAMRTDDIEAVIKRLKEIGATFVVEPVRTPDGLIEMAVLDPDGVRMQINQHADRAPPSAKKK